MPKTDWLPKEIALDIKGFVLAGPEMRWLRLGNLLAHMATALALYFLIRRLLVDLDKKPAPSLSAETAAFVSATFFALHPLAIFTQGYLIQRTIVCATLFALLSWLAFWRAGPAIDNCVMVASGFSFSGR